MCELEQQIWVIYGLRY